jgi:hypothetical protein
MAVTQGVINDTFCKLIPYPNGNVFTEKGFEVLAIWSEQQEWWDDFARLNGLGQNWRDSPLRDRYVIIFLLFRFVVD